MNVKECESIGYSMFEKKRIKTRRMMNPYRSIELMTTAQEAGKKEKSILEPSSGGIGTRLNMAKARFTNTIEEVIV